MRQTTFVIETTGKTLAPLEIFTLLTPSPVDELLLLGPLLALEAIPAM